MRVLGRGGPGAGGIGLRRVPWLGVGGPRWGPRGHELLRRRLWVAVALGLPRHASQIRTISNPGRADKRGSALEVGIRWGCGGA